MCEICIDTALPSDHFTYPDGELWFESILDWHDGPFYGITLMFTTDPDVDYRGVRSFDRADNASTWMYDHFDCEDMTLAQALQIINNSPAMQRPAA